VIDTSELDVENVVDRIEALVRDRFPRMRDSRGSTEHSDGCRAEPIS
jgi:hypothetical protein